MIPESRDASFRFCVRIHSLDILGAECLKTSPPKTSELQFNRIVFARIPKGYLAELRLIISDQGMR
jgi:hypothetical protein